MSPGSAQLEYDRRGPITEHSGLDKASVDCNGAARGALQLARLGFPVKIMAGGITGWIDEGFTLETGPAK
jgi:hypothetical protein